MYKFLCALITICLVGRAKVDSKNVPCNGNMCGKSSMPILDNVRAPLYAELDTDSLNKQLKEYIDTNVEEEIEDTLENKTKIVMDRKLEVLKIDIVKNITASRKDFNDFKKDTSNLTSTFKKTLMKVIETQRNLSEQDEELKENMKAIALKLDTALNFIKKNQAHLPTRDIGDKYAKDCKELNATGDGVYLIKPTSYLIPVKVYCETKTDGGGWTVIQRRFDGSVSFYRDWDDYENGFGNMAGEHWLGNKLIHAITSKRTYELRVDLEDWNHQKRYANYSTFVIGDAKSKYKLTVGGYNGNAGDSLNYHDGNQFSTEDQDNDEDDRNCAVKSSGAWWYKTCYESNLNGIYNETSMWPSMSWRGWHGNSYSFKSTRMMIR